MQIKVLDYKIVMAALNVSKDTSTLIKKLIDDVSDIGKVGILQEGDVQGIGFDNIDVFVKFCEGAKLMPDENLHDKWFSLEWIEVADV